MLYIIMLGPPGCGKGTQADLISNRFKIPHISTGDLLRKNPNLTDAIRKKMNAGEMLQNVEVLGLLGDRLSEQDAQNGWILDGFPRTASQAELLDKMFSEEKIYVLHIVVSDNTIEERLTNRRTCSECGQIYNLVNNPSKVEGICDTCSGSLVQRDDDKKEVISERLRIYKEKTAPLVEHYAKAGNLYTIDCSKRGTPEEVEKMMLEVLPD